ncbi:MAG: ribosome maturation factor RimM [Clostridiales bacterium]|nr:ribosome maturation factor RimM [Clostridiales bacterium]
MRDNLIEIGKIVNTHGIRGEVKVQPWCDDPYIFDELEYLIIDGREYEVIKNRLHKNCQIIQLDGITSMNDAELMRNKIVKVERDALELPEGRYFVTDIEGLTVREENGRVLGVVDEVIKTGSNDVYSLKDTFNHKPILIPVIDGVIIETNIDEGYITVRLMKGLIDE